MRTLPGVQTVFVAAALWGCSGGENGDAETHRVPDAAAHVRDAAQSALGAGPADIRMNVSSPTASYSVRGGIELAADRFSARALVERTSVTDLDRAIDVIGLQGETYLMRTSGLAITDRDCAFDPHAAVGNFGGAASVQEALTLAGVAVRLLRDGTSSATVVRRFRGRVTYRVRVDPRKGSVAPSAEGSDELSVADPRGLARGLAPIRVDVGRDGRLRRLGLVLRGFRPRRLGPNMTRNRRPERVAIKIDLSDFGRPLRVRRPRCIAME